MDAFQEQRKLVEEYCFASRTKRTGLEEFLTQSEQRQKLIKDWDFDTASQIMNYRRTTYSFSNAKLALLSFCKYAGYEEVLSIISRVKFINSVKYYPSFAVMKEEIQNNIKEMNLYDIRCYDNLVVTAYLLAMGLTLREIFELKKSDYQNGIIQVGERKIVCPEDVVRFFKIYYATESYTVQCKTRLKTLCYHDTDSFIKSTFKSETTFQTIQGYSKKIPRICDGKGFFEIKASKTMWDLFQKYGYDLENPNVLLDTDWESVKRKSKERISVTNTGIDASEREAFLDTLIQYRNNNN